MRGAVPRRVIARCGGVRLTGYNRANRIYRNRHYSIRHYSGEPRPPADRPGFGRWLLPGCPQWGSAAVGDREVIRVRGGIGAVPGDEHRARAGADGHRGGDVPHVGGAVVAPDPQRGAGGGIVGGREVIRARGGPIAVPGHVYRAAAGADGHRRGVVVAVGEAFVAFAPQRGAGGGVVGDGGVVGVPGGVIAVSGHVHRAPAGADGQRAGDVGVVVGAVVAPHPQRGAGGGVVGGGEVTLAEPERGLNAVSGHVYRAAAGADGQRVGGVGAVARAVIPADPQRGAGGGVVGDRGVVEARAGPGAFPGDEHRAPAGADRHRRGGVVDVDRPVVPADPQRGTGGGVVGDRGVVLIVVDPATAVAAPGDIHRVPAGADRHRRGVVVAVAVVPADPQRGQFGGVVGDRGVVRG